MLLQQIGDARSRYLQLGEGEHLLAEVFQGGSDVMDIRPVDNQEAVMAFLVGMDAYRGILAVVLLHVQLQLRADGLCVDIGFHAGIALAEHQQHRLVHIIVYQQYGLFRRADEVSCELVGIEYLAVVEDAFYRRHRRADKEVYLAVNPVQALLMLDKFAVHTVFQIAEALVEGIAFQQVFFQHLVCPLAKLRASDGFHAVPYGNDDIKVIILDPVLLAVCGSCQVFLDN